MELPRGMAPDFSPDPSLEKDVQMSRHCQRGMMPVSWPCSCKRRVPGCKNKGHVVLGRPWLCQQVHKDGVGCGLAEDEGSQGD